MGAVNVGSASVTIMPTMNGFAGKLNKQLGSAGTSGGAAFSKAFGGRPAAPRRNRLEIQERRHLRRQRRWGRRPARR